jgi:drug/metabolite transporter (DMT)-like permease
MWALETGGAGKTSVLTYTMPFWLLLMAWSVLGERLRGIQWVAVILALGGLVFILSPWKLHGVVSSVLAVCTGISWAGSTVVAKVIHKRHQVDVFSLTAWQMVLGTIPLVIIAVATGGGMPVWTLEFVGALAYNVILGNGVAWLLWLFVLRVLPAGTTGLASLANPVLGVTFAWAVLGERPGWAEVLGMALILLGIAVLTLREAARRPLR